MMTILKGAAVAAVALLGGLAPAQSATVSLTDSAFQRVTNDGVFTLTAEQQAFFGTSADRIGFLRARANANTEVRVGATFDAATVAARCRIGCATIDRFLNGDALGLTYTGGYLDALGTTTVSAQAGQYVGAVAFLFSGSPVVFLGSASSSATFTRGATRGDLDFAVPSPVPLPAAGWMLVAGLGALAAARRRRRNA